MEEENPSRPITLDDLKKIVKVDKKVCRKITIEYEKCIKENKNNFKKCIKLYD